MSKIDFEKDRRRRLPKDVCPDAPWRNEDASIVTRLGPRHDGALSEHDHSARKKQSTAFVPRLDGTAESLKTIAADMSDFYYRHCLPERKLELLIQGQKRMARIVEREGAAIKSTREYKRAESACRRAATALHRLMKRADK